MPQNPLPPLEKVDPAKVWQPWEPSEQDPWNLKWAGHLFRRATLGRIPPIPKEGQPYDHLARLRDAVKNGLQTTLEVVFRNEPEADDYQDFLSFINDLGLKTANQNNPMSLRGWWLYAIWYSPQQLREKMTLFWHNHFATSIVKVQRASLMYYQNKLLRQHALGKFEPFLQAMSKDPAMLIWLDSNGNVKGKPNENYARELMELFSLGVKGGYTEQDIREAARAFTGWHTENELFSFKKVLHDDAEKTVLKHKGNWNGDDIVRICLKQDSCAQFLVRKLYRYFISETAEPPDALLEPLAASLRKSDYDVGELVKTMLRSRHFFSDYAYRQRIKSPVEFVLDAARQVGQNRIEPRAMADKTDTMGMQLFAPPNVKGWEGGRSWLNTATVLARHNFAQMLTKGSGQVTLGGGSTKSIGIAVVPSDIVRQYKVTEPKDVVVLLADILLQGDLSEAARAKLAAYIGEAKPDTEEWAQSIRDMFHAIMTMPEYQLA